jgi:hypothetical protein
VYGGIEIGETLDDKFIVCHIICLKLLIVLVLWSRLTVTTN